MESHRSGIGKCVDLYGEFAFPVFFSYYRGVVTLALLVGLLAIPQVFLSEYLLAEHFELLNRV